MLPEVKILFIPEKEIAVREQIAVTKSRDNIILFKHITSLIYNPMKKASKVEILSKYIILYNDAFCNNDYIVLGVQKVTL